MAGPTGCGRHVGGALGRVGIVAGLRGRYRGLGNGLGFGWLGSIGLSLWNGSNESIGLNTVAALGRDAEAARALCWFGSSLQVAVSYAQQPAIFALAITTAL